MYTALDVFRFRTRYTRAARRRPPRIAHAAARRSGWVTSNRNVRSSDATAARASRVILERKAYAPAAGSGRRVNTCHRRRA